ncbi:DUF2818 family protein [Denitratisoma sp. agr-D3]
MTAAQFLVVVLAVLAANLPFISTRLFFFGRPFAGGKHLGWHLLELLCGYGLVGLLAALLESRAHGSVYPQHWEFYAVTLFLFFVFAFPGFAMRYLWRQRRA